MWQKKSIKKAFKGVHNLLRSCSASISNFLDMGFPMNFTSFSPLFLGGIEPVNPLNMPMMLHSYFVVLYHITV